jgi:hypothetical protein
LAVILVIAVYLCLTFSGFDLFNFSFLSNLFRARPIVIDKTANVVEEINRLAELTTAAYDEDYVIVRQSPRESSVLGIKITTDFETYEESGKWSHEEVTGFKNEARIAIESGIPERAEESGKQKLSSFLKALGFQKVFIEIDK